MRKENYLMNFSALVFELEEKEFYPLSAAIDEAYWIQRELYDHSIDDHYHGLTNEEYKDSIETLLMEN